VESNASRRRFRPGTAATLFTAFFLPVLLALGAWQLERAEYKRTLFDAFSAGHAPVALSDHPRGLAELPRFSRVHAAGRYLAGRQFLLDNMVEAGRAGYRVLTPLELDDGRILVVDRGWVGKDFASAALPDVAVDGAPRRVTGRLDHLPRAGIDLARNTPTGWPRVVQFPVAGELAEALDAEVVPGLLLLDADQPDGYRREWRAAESGPERHVGYAVQWLALAVTLVVLYLAWAFRKGD
jgi:surfeit locus 1 family protein